MKKNSFIMLILMLFFVEAVAQNDAPISHPPLVDFTPQKPPFKLQGEQLSNKNRFLRYSILTGYREGAEVAPKMMLYFVDDVTGTKRACVYNKSIENILTGGLLNSSRVLLEVKDPSRYRYDPRYGPEKEWLRKNGVCFEMALPEGTFHGSKIGSEDWSKDGNTVQQELSRILRLRFGFEKRLVNTLVLVRTSNQDKLKSKGIGEPSSDNKGNFNNTNPFGRLNSLLYEAKLPPLVDETGYEGLVDMELNISDWKDIIAIRKGLQRYDLDLREEKREFKMFVIRELDFSR